MHTHTLKPLEIKGFRAHTQKPLEIKGFSYAEILHKSYVVNVRFQKVL
jgi:hypothetical protein